MQRRPNSKIRVLCLTRWTVKADALSIKHHWKLRDTYGVMGLVTNHSNRYRYEGSIPWRTSAYAEIWIFLWFIAGWASSSNADNLSRTLVKRFYQQLRANRLHIKESWLFKEWEVINVLICFGKRLPWKQSKGQLRRYYFHEEEKYHHDLKLDKHLLNSTLYQRITTGKTILKLWNILSKQ